MIKGHNIQKLLTPRDIPAKGRSDQIKDLRRDAVIRDVLSWYPSGSVSEERPGFALT